MPDEETLAAFELENILNISGLSEHATGAPPIGDNAAMTDETEKQWALRILNVTKWAVCCNQMNDRPVH
jgi:hypothetical protein